LMSEGGKSRGLGVFSSATRANYPNGNSGCY
jgi:hypothetical protein